MLTRQPDNVTSKYLTHVRKCIPENSVTIHMEAILIVSICHVLQCIQLFLAACEMGRYGCNCSQVCSTGTYGLNCYHQCYCTADEVCDPAVGCTNVTTTLSPTTLSQTTARTYNSTSMNSGNI